MIASILSKKIAAGATHLLIDIPMGPTAKVHSQTEALKLRKLFEYIGDQTNLELEVIITDGRQPVGNGIGPLLEARDVMQILQNNPQAPVDLKEKSLQIETDRRLNTFLILGMREEAIIFLIKKFEQEKANEQSRYFLLKKQARFDILRSDPRFQEILAKHKELYEENLRKYGDIDI